MDKLVEKVRKKYGLSKIPSYSQLIIATKGKSGLKRKPVRFSSGVAPVAVMTKPIKCPHGRCIMCPTVSGVPQSYTGKEPASRRGLRNKFHPYLQVFNRLEQYMLLGNKPEKVELILMGGNFTSFPVRYQNWFISGCLKGMNDFSGFLNYSKFIKYFNLDVKNEMTDIRTSELHKKFLKRFVNVKLSDSIKKNEKAKVRCVGMCVETRPDYCSQKEINLMLKQGVTRVEVGAQHLLDDVLCKLGRKHSVKDVVEATKLLKDNGYKVGYHMMLGAPGSSFAKDVKMFKELFSNPNFKPDALKIYPCMVFKGTKLYNLYKKGKYKPLSTTDAIKLINKIKKYIPEYCRVMRVQRDIPSYMSAAGVDKTNLRQYLDSCRCIRCRQVKEIKGKVSLKRFDYSASGGKEIFLSYENNDKIVGFLRLRICNKGAFVRELHVYGAMTGLGKKGKVQHRGYGKKLLREAEKICKKFKIKKLKVISGIGVRMYYKKLKYRLEGPYMIKYL